MSYDLYYLLDNQKSIKKLFPGCYVQSCRKLKDLHRNLRTFHGKMEFKDFSISYCRTKRRENSCRCVGVGRISSASFLPVHMYWLSSSISFFTKSSYLNQLFAILDYCYLNWRSSFRWRLQPETLHCPDGRTWEMCFNFPVTAMTTTNFINCWLYNSNFIPNKVCVHFNTFSFASFPTSNF